jgi:superfamily II DNA/RNA helicase
MIIKLATEEFDGGKSWSRYFYFVNLLLILNSKVKPLERFEDLAVFDWIKSAIAQLRLKTPTRIQQYAIPAALAGTAESLLLFKLVVFIVCFV